jgi:hypothetical protein
VDGTTTITVTEETESNRFGAWVKLHKARAESGSVIKVFDIFGQQICELPVPDGAKRAEGRR